MMIEKKTVYVESRECMCYVTESGADALLVQPVDEHDLEGMDSELEIVQKSVAETFQLVAIKVNDWQSELTPWAAPPVFGKVPFGDQAPEMLRFITEGLLPTMSFRRVFLGGYSLAGLFALWAGYNSDVFQGIAAASPSVWYPDWMEYAEAHTPRAGRIYLSMGDKEEKTKNPVMARVGECIRRQQELLTMQGVNTILEWNEGNHFRDANLRMAKGFAWVMKNV